MDIAWRRAHDGPHNGEWLAVDGNVVFYKVSDRDACALDLATMLCERKAGGTYVQVPKRLNRLPDVDTAWQTLQSWPPRKFTGDEAFRAEAWTSLDEDLREQWVARGYMDYPKHAYLEAVLRWAANAGGLLTRRDAAEEEWDVLIEGTVVERPADSPAEFGLPAWFDDKGNEIEPPDGGFEFDEYFYTKE